MSLTADGLGVVEGKFTIPAGIPVGSKLVEFDGSETEAAATFIGRGVLKIEDLRLVNRITTTRVLRQDLDPLAQTFTAPPAVDPSGSVVTTRQVAALDLWFTAVGPSNVLVHIRETSLGVPTNIVIAEALLMPSQITVGAWTRFKFTPVSLEPNREYCIVVMCDDAVAEVATAGIGEFDADNQQWVAAQPYQVGVLLSSSNGSTWTAHQTKDLAFRLLTCDYNVDTNTVFEGSTTKVVTLPPVTVVDADHLMVLAAIVRPTADCDVVFTVTVDGEDYETLEGRPFTLAARFSGEVTWVATLTGTFTDSPILHKDIHLVVATRLSGSTYVTRQMECYSGTSVTMYYDATLPTPATVTAEIEDGAGNWEAFPLEVATALGDGIYEYKHTYTLLTDEDQTRVKLTLSGSGVALPVVKNLRVAIT